MELPETPQPQRSLVDRAECLLTKGDRALVSTEAPVLRSQLGARKFPKGLLLGPYCPEKRLILEPERGFP